MKRKEGSSRREFIQRVSLLGVAGLGGALLGACTSEQQPESDAQATTEPCSDLSGLTSEEIQTRENFGYVSASPSPGRRCSNCQFWIEAEAGQSCGGCVLITGPINPEGYCNSWAPQT